MNEDMWTSTGDDAHAARAALATMKEIHNGFAQYINSLRRVLNGDAYAGMTVARQLALAESLARVAEALMTDGVARSAAVDKYGDAVLSLLDGSNQHTRVPLSTMVQRWGASDELTSTLKDLLREELIDFAQHAAGVSYWILPKGTRKVARAAAVAAPSGRRAVGGDDV